MCMSFAFCAINFNLKLIFFAGNQTILLASTIPIALMVVILLVLMLALFICNRRTGHGVKYVKYNNSMIILFFILFPRRNAQADYEHDFKQEKIICVDCHNMIVIITCK